MHKVEQGVGLSPVLILTISISVLKTPEFPDISFCPNLVTLGVRITIPTFKSMSIIITTADIHTLHEIIKMSPGWIY